MEIVMLMGSPGRKGPTPILVEQLEKKPHWTE